MMGADGLLSTRKPNPIRKFSLRYDPAQDRIAWIAEDAGGGTTRLWLTRRICERMLSALVPLLEEATAAGAPKAHQEVLQSWEQAAAVAAKQDVSPVVPSQRTVAGLVHTVSMRRTLDGFILTLAFNADAERKLALTLAETRQMLTAMHGLYTSADWPSSAWPSWLIAPPAAAPTDAVN